MAQIVHVVCYQLPDLGIGQDSNLLYRLDTDMAHFRKLTLNHVILMGRKTYDSIGRALPQRVNVVLSRTPSAVSASGIHVFSSVPEALAWCQLHHHEKTIFVIGGSEIYSATMPWTSRVIATEISGTAPANVFYPELDRQLFTVDIVSNQQGTDYFRPDQGAQVYSIVTYVKNKVKTK